MGLELVVQTPAQPCPPWPTLREALAQRGLPAQLRMIDGELAFHDEVPPRRLARVARELAGGDGHPGAHARRDPLYRLGQRRRRPPAAMARAGSDHRSTRRRNDPSHSSRNRLAG
jgi:hypothetical protein